MAYERGDNRYGGNNYRAGGDHWRERERGYRGGDDDRGFFERAGGRHHSIPCSWIETVDEKVTVNKNADEAMAAWRDEDRSRALFEREDQGSDGPHMLNRSFSGTYSDRE